MAALTLTQMQATVALNCDNLPTSDPVYTDSNNLIRYINEAANNVILMAPIDPTTGSRRVGFNAFPEFRDYANGATTTTNAQGYIAIPTAPPILVIDSLTCTRSTTAYAGGSQNEYPITETDIDTFAMLDKSATGWPELWVRQGANILLWPTPTTAFRTIVVIRGTRGESDLSTGSETFAMNYLFNPAVVAEATSLTLAAMGRIGDSEAWHARAARKVGEIVGLLGAANRKNTFRMRVF